MPEIIKTLAIVGTDPLRANEENYFYCDGMNDSDVIQAAIDYLAEKKSEMRAHK